MRSYYEAYDARYRTAHARGISWASDVPTPIVLDTLKKYAVPLSAPILEIGCGEGRDAACILQNGYHLTPTDISPEAIAYCRTKYPEFAARFAQLDCLHGQHSKKYDFLYAVAVLHMFVLDEDRANFYRFLRCHLTPNGIALICTMGDGVGEMSSDISTAFTLQERNHPTGKMLVAGTSCRMVSFPTFRRELADHGFTILEQGITESMPEFNSLMYAIVRVQA